MREQRVRVNGSGDLRLPPEALRLLGVADGGELVLREEEGHVVLARADQPGRRAGRAQVDIWSARHDEGDEEG